MSSFYLDIIKDRLYCEYKSSHTRRSCQTVLAEVLNVLVRMISPILSFTSEEIYSAMPENMRTKQSIHLEKWFSLNPEYINDQLSKKWEKIYTLRKEVNKKIEEKRQSQIIGLSLDARVYLNISNEDYLFIKNYSTDELADIFLVSQVQFSDNKLEDTEINNISIEVTKASGIKCERSWKYSEMVGDNKFGNVTPRDAKVLQMMLENGELEINE